GGGHRIPAHLSILGSNTILEGKKTVFPFLIMAPSYMAKLGARLFVVFLWLTINAGIAAATIQGYIGDIDMTCPSVCRCDEDFIYCNDRGLSSIPSLPPSASVLYLQNNHINNPGLPTSLERHLSVRVVYLYDNELDEFPMHLPPSVRELHLQDNNIRTIPRSTLARMPLLEKLHLDDNSISTVSIEDQAFADNPRLRLLFLSRNHLSSIPSGLPASLEELRLDDNRISTIPTHAFRGLNSLRCLVLDGNLLANQRIADDTFSRLSNLTELSLVRNSLQTPPVNLPSAHLQRLSLQDNALTHMPRGSLDGMHRLQRLDLSGNNLTTLPRGLFKDLDSLGQLLVRGNPWHCGCNLRWLYDWLSARGNTITVRGLTCHGPDRVRDMALIDLGSEMEECEVVRLTGTKEKGAVGGVESSTTNAPSQGSLFTLRSKRPGFGFPDSGLDYTLSSSGVGKSLALNVKPLSHNSIPGIIGGATATVSLALILGVFCWYGHRTGNLCSRDHYTRSSSRKSKTYDDYIESGTKKDNTILEIHGPGFQMTPMPACQPMQPKPLREDYIIHTIFPSNGTGLYKGSNHVSNAGHGTNRGYREGGVPDIDYCYT
ncbi:hypothetical protein GOODEAATRI_024666, partial [Goodea atripinnis]